MGVTGDLSKKKILPAIYKLALHKKIKNYAVVGIGRRDITSKSILSHAKKHIKQKNSKVLNQLEKRFTYFQGDFSNKEKYKELGKLLTTIEKKHRLSGNRLFYLATLPEHFEDISENLKKYRLAEHTKTIWSRIVFEKPFGNDLKSAKKINKCIKKVFNENQIYRIDHYLGKELVQNISIIRFTNTLFEPLWNRKYIDHVQITLSENFGVEERAGFYDKYGALKDVVQNHMMQLIALTAMESPKLLTEKYIRDEKVKILKAIRKIDRSVFGQYKGYEKEVGKKSRTETFAALRLFINNPRWKKVPFYLITGKNMKERTASIYIQFKDAPCLLFNKVCNFNPNYLIIQIQPEEGMYFQFNAKAPGKPTIIPVKMDFSHTSMFGVDTPEAYENLLLDVINGDQSTFIRSDEIEESWRIIDHIKKGKIHIYEKGSYPEAAKEMIQKDGRDWHLRVK